MKPYLKNNRTNAVEHSVCRRLREHDLDEIMRVQTDAVSELQDAAVYVQSTRADILRMIHYGEIHGIFADGVLCGVCGFLPSAAAEDLPAEIGLSAAQRAQSVNLECYFVARDYRGNGIARELTQLCVNRARDGFDARRILATISPRNLPSLLTLMSVNGFHIRALRQMYGCKLRYILCCEPENEKRYTYYERFSVYDVYGISRALAQGYEGIATFKNNEGIFVWLAK